MTVVRLNPKHFQSVLNNVVEYSLGFLDGVQKGKKVFLAKLGVSTIEFLQEYIDTNARMNPEALHHVYEWYKVGSPDARLYELNYTVSNLGLSVKSSFRQSKSVKQGSYEPFYNKARIMEEGIPVVIKPKKSEVLVFEDDGQTVFTRGPVNVANPGGLDTKNAYEKVFDSFFRYYFSQGFLRASGVLHYLDNPLIYKKDLKKGARGGRSVGNKTGYTWIVNATPGVDK